MGRELKRVPLDFDWRIGEVWAGYLNPYDSAEECPRCHGSGYSPEAKYLSDQWYGNEVFDPATTGSTPFTPETPAVRYRAERNVTSAPEFYGSGESAIIREAQRLCRHYNGGWCHHLDQNDVNALWAEGRLADFNPQWRDNHNEGVPAPKAADVNLWSISGFGHDAINQWICVRAKAERLGVPPHCSHCKGDGEIWSSNAAKMLYEAWQKIEPPTGDGWQLWETVTEGSPVSPVFATSDKLIAWMVQDGYSEAGARKFVEIGYAPSLIMSKHGVESGVDGLAHE